MPNIDSISTNILIDSTQSIQLNNTQVVHDTIRIAVSQESIIPDIAFPIPVTI